MYASTGTDDDTTGFQTYNYEEIKAAVDTAHQFGKKIAIHSYGPDGARDAVRAGTDSLEHATDMDEATIQAMAKRGTFYVPTIDHNRYYLDNWQKIGYANGFQEKTKAFIERNLETARKAHKVARAEPPGAEALGQRGEIIGAECGFQFGKRAKREHETSAHPADLGLDLAAVKIGHVLLPI